MERYKAKVWATASVELIVKLKESINGDIELDEVSEVLEVDDIDDIEVITKF